MWTVVRQQIQNARHGSRIAATRATQEAKHPLTQKNARFVQKFGFRDLPNDAVRQFRDRHTAASEACAQYAPQDAARLQQKVDELYRKAGSNPALRRNLVQLHRFVKEHGSNLSAKEMETALVLLGKGRLDLTDAASRRRFAALVKSGRMHRSLRDPKMGLARLSATETNAILKHLRPVKDPSEDGSWAATVAGHMARYVLDTRKAYALRAQTDELLVKLGSGGSKSYEKHRAEDWNSALHEIASAEYPAKARSEAVRNAHRIASFGKDWIRDAVQYRYGEILKAHGFRPAFAHSMGKWLYKAGGPGSKAGIMLLTNLLAAKNRGKVTKEQVLALAKELHAKTLGVQPAALENVDFDKLLAPTGRAGVSMEQAKSGPWSNALAITDGLTTPVATALELGGASTLGACMAAGGVVTAVIGSFVTAYQVASIWKVVREAESARYGARGFWTAIRAGWDLGRLPDMDSPEILGRRKTGVRGTIHEAGAHAFKRKFAETYETLKSMPEAQRKAFCGAMLEIRREFHRAG